MRITVSTLLALIVVAILVIAFRGRAHADKSPDTNTSNTKQTAPVREADPLMQTNFVALAPSKEGPADAKAMVAWQPDKQSGVIHIKGLPAAEKGKDYQLWVVDAEHKDPIDAGMVRVEQDGTAQVRFRPADVARRVKAFALSLEREGGVPKREGPILLIGNV